MNKIPQTTYKVEDKLPNITMGDIEKSFGVKFNKRCSVCNKIATKEIQVIRDDGEHFIPRCNKHIIKGYKGIIRGIK